MTGMTTKSQPLMVVENKAFGNRAYCAINEGLGKVMRFGGNDAEVLDRLRWIREVLGPALGRALREAGGIAAQAADRARAHHGRRDASAQRRLLEPAAAPACAGAGADGRDHTASWSTCLDFIGRNDQFFLNVAMAMGKALDRPGARHRRRRPSSPR